MNEAGNRPSLRRVLPESAEPRAGRCWKTCLGSRRQGPAKLTRDSAAGS